MHDQQRYKICRLDELEASTSKGFAVEYQGQQVEGFVVRDADSVSAYYNACPHTGANLNWTPDQFLTLDGEFIQCSIHGALFRLNDGLCIRGPCVGQHLKPLEVVIVSGHIYLDLCAK